MSRAGGLTQVGYYTIGWCNTPASWFGTIGHDPGKERVWTGLHW